MATATATPRIGYDPTNPLSTLGQPVSEPGNTLSSEGLMERSMGLAGEQKGTANALLTAGGKGLQPVLDLLMKLVGGDRTAMMEAAGPEVNSVAAQYDAARKSISGIAPKGGGRNALLASSRYKEAGDITNLLAKTRTEATGTLGTLASGLVGMGVTEQASAQQGYAQILQALLNKDISENQAWTQILTMAGSSAGSMVASYYLGQSGKQQGVSI